MGGGRAGRRGGIVIAVLPVVVVGVEVTWVVGGGGTISKTWWSCPELSSTGQCYSIYSEGPPMEYFYRTVTVSIVCPSIFRLSQYLQAIPK